MEELRKFAWEHYFHSKGSPDKDAQKQRIQKFRKEMVPDKKGDIGFKEFSAYMKRKGCPTEMCSEKLFKKLNQDGSGKLKDLDVILVCYIVETKRSLCDGFCREFLKGNSYFICVKCYINDDHHDPSAQASSFNLCYSCYRNRKYKHRHSKFLDPIALLHYLKTKKKQDNASSNIKEGTMVHKQRPPSAQPSQMPTYFYGNAPALVNSPAPQVYVLGNGWAPVPVLAHPHPPASGQGNMPHMQRAQLAVGAGNLVVGVGNLMLRGLEAMGDATGVADATGV